MKSKPGCFLSLFRGPHPVRTGLRAIPGGVPGRCGQGAFLAALALCVLLALPAQAGNRTDADPAPRALYAHFLALPEAFPDGSPAASEIERFRRSLVEMCGGYTELGPASGAWMDPSGQVVAEGNRAFLVTCPDNRGAELSRAIRERFRQQEAYILVWGVERP